MASPPPDPLARVDKVLGPITWLAAAFAVVVLLVGPELIGAKQAGTTSKPASKPRTGQQIFASEGCAGCHTLKAAGSTGTTGPNLDQVKPSVAAVEAIVRSGGGVMPAFKLAPAELQAVAQFVSSSAGR